MFVALLVFAPVLPLFISAPDWGALALLVALPVLLGSGPGPTYAPVHHRYAMVVPFIVHAASEADGRLSPDLRRLVRPQASGRRQLTWRIALPSAVLMTLVMNAVLVNVLWSPGFWVAASDGSSGLSTYRRSSRDELKDQWLAGVVPPDAPLLVSPMLAPHVAHRRDLHIAVPTDRTTPPLDALLDISDLIVLDGLFEPVEILANDWVGYDWLTLSAALVRPEFHVMSAQDGLLLLSRSDGPALSAGREQRALVRSVTVTPGSNAVDVEALLDTIGLVDASVTAIGDGRYRLSYT